MFSSAFFLLFPFFCFFVRQKCRFLFLLANFRRPSLNFNKQQMTTNRVRTNSWHQILEPIKTLYIKAISRCISR